MATAATVVMSSPPNAGGEDDLDPEPGDGGQGGSGDTGTGDNGDPGEASIS